MIKKWDNFWLNCNYSFLDVFRKAFGIWLFLNSILILFNFEHFLENGLPSYFYLRAVFPFKAYSLFPYLPDYLTIALYLGFIVCSIVLITGKPYLKFCIIYCFLVHQSFLFRNTAFICGSDHISNYILFYFMLAYCLNLKSLSFRLLQIQFLFIYLFAAAAKLSTLPWQRGEAMWYFLIYFPGTRFDYHWMADCPIVIKLITYSGCFLELSLPFLLIFKKTKNFAILSGIVFHLFIILIFKLYMFESLMIILYLTMIDEHFLNFIKKIYSPIMNAPKGPEL